MEECGGFVRLLRGFEKYPIDHVALRARPEGCPALGLPADARATLAVLSGWPDYRPTPLLVLEPLAALVGVKRIYYKDESGRFGLGAFKAMGAAYATGREVARVLGRPHLESFDDIRAAVKSSGKTIVVACATDGNHGRAVAWAASRLGVSCVVFVHESVSAARVKAIAEQGASVRRAGGNYDDAVRAARQEAARCGWRVVSDTAYEGYEQVPTDVMHGYAALAEELLNQIPTRARPTHIFAQAGVGGFAAALFTHLCARLADPAPVTVCVEPLEAACLLASARKGARTAVIGPLDTIMAGLACGEPSTIAWSLLSRQGCDFLAISDEAAAATMRILAVPALCGRSIIGGESGAAGVAGLLCALAHEDYRRALKLNSDSVVLTVGTEGATDPDAYAAIMAADGPPGA